MAKNSSFDYSKVPFQFGLCAITDCPLADTCLRRVAFEHTPADVHFPPTLNPKTAKTKTKQCKYYRSNKKLRYGKGFIRTTEALTVKVSGKFRYTLIARWGFKKYYQKRKGETLLSPDEQAEVIELAKRLDLHMDDYFDAYVEEYDWK